MIKVLIADDHQIFIDGLILLLSQHENIEVVATANNGKEVLTILDQKPVDIAILDVEMPELDGIDAAELIKIQHPEVKILILSMFNDAAFISRLIEIGVNGYILKNKGQEELVEAIQDIAKDKKYFGREVTETFISGVQTKSRKKEKTPIPITKREVDVVQLIAAGKSTPQIADILCIAASTVETHRRNLIDKTGVANSKELIIWAIQEGYSGQ